MTTVLGDVATEFGTVPPGAEAIEKVGLSGTALGIGLAVIRAAGAGSMLAAAAADTLGRRRVLLVAVTAGLLLTVVATGAPTFVLFVGLVALARPLLSGTNTIVGIVAAERTTTAGRSSALAYVQATYAAGSGLIAVLRGVFDGLDFRLVLALSGVGLLLLPLLFRRIEEPAIYARAVTGRARPRFAAVDRRFWGRLALLAVVGIATGLVTGPAFTYLFVYGESVLGQSAGFMAVLVVVAAPVGLAGLLAGRWLADRGRRAAAAGSTALFALAAWVTYAGTVPTLAGGYLAAIFAGGMMGPPVGALLAETFPTDDRGAATGWVQGIGVAGSVAGLVLFGVLGDALGSFGGAATLLYLPVVPIALLYLRLPETVDRELDELDADATVERAPGGGQTP